MDDVVTLVNTQDLLKLIDENPTLQMIPMVKLTDIDDNEGNYYGEFDQSFIADYYLSKSKMWIKDENDMDDVVMDMMPYDEYELLNDEQIKQWYDSIKWTKAIITSIRVEV